MAHIGRAARKQNTVAQHTEYSQNRKRTSSIKWMALLASVTFGTAATHRTAHAQYAGQLSSIVMDAKTGAVLSQSSPDLRRYPASLTKLMTLYMAFSALRAGTISLDQAVPVSIHATTMEPSKLGVVPGTHLTVEQAILALVTKSANDAACALGELLGGGSEPQFAAMMTQQAHALGMSSTTFRNASGLPDPDQMTTARDLAVLARHLVNDFPEDYHYFSTAYFRFHGRMIPNHNPMLKAYVGADGMKTGYTQEAGRNLVTSAIRNNVRLVGVVMGASSNPQRTLVMADQLDRGFDAEGVAPVERPLVLARNTVSGRHHHAGRVIMLAAASARRGHAPVEVAEAPLTRHGHHVRATPVVGGHHVRLIGAKVHPATASTSSKHATHHNTRRRT